ncbi:MAG: hypothetical protein IPI49_16885 [Myxococcales bacterium]|mgnify:CR=1 FL=1|nr:hypothetical protein [Myxococcales bacterium]HRC54272.1 hypothetical protein [Kofleriaceae bacterium]
MSNLGLREAGRVVGRRAVRLAAALGLLVSQGACGDDSGDPDEVLLRADNGVPLCGKPVVYLNFEGVSLLKGAADDARANVSEAPDFPESGLEIAPYANTAERDQLLDILDIKLASLRIPVMHTRPRSGDYFMLVFLSKFTVEVPSARTTFNCGYTNPNTIGFLNTAFYTIHGGQPFIAHGALNVIGRAVGLDAVASAVAPANCMVNDDFLASCTFSPVSSTKGPCATGAQDQVALLAAMACN